MFDARFCAVERKNICLKPDFALGSGQTKICPPISSWTGKTPHSFYWNSLSGANLRIVFQSPLFCYTETMLLDELRKIIAERDIRQKDICAALGLSQSYTSELLSGKKDFSLDLLEKLCDFLQVDIRLIDKYRK